MKGEKDMEEEKITELEAREKKLLKELKKWDGKDSEAAFQEKQAILNEIMEIRRKMNTSKDNNKDANKENSQTPEELLAELKENKSEKETEIKRLENQVARLETEKENYNSMKNPEYVAIYKEYENSIKKAKEEIDKLKEGDSPQEVDRKAKILTQGRMKQEEEISRLEKEIGHKQKITVKKQLEL